MLGNVLDPRTDPACPEVDAVFEPSFHEAAKRSGDMPYFDPDEPLRDAVIDRSCPG